MVNLYAWWWLWLWYAWWRSIGVHPHSPSLMSAGRISPIRPFPELDETHVKDGEKPHLWRKTRHVQPWKSPMCWVNRVRLAQFHGLEPAFRPKKCWMFVGIPGGLQLACEVCSSDGNGRASQGFRVFLCGKLCHKLVTSNWGWLTHKEWCKIKLPSEDGL